MLILLVRHAKAGSRSEWIGDDAFRPLSHAGQAQADGLVDVLGQYRPGRVLSSPFTRCVQTVQPLATSVGGKVEDEPALAEGQTRLALVLVRHLLGESNDDTVVCCTHGDLVPEILRELVESDGVDLGPAPQCEKGSTWLLESAGDRFVRAEYLPPPSV